MTRHAIAWVRPLLIVAPVLALSLTPASVHAQAHTVAPPSQATAWLEAVNTHRPGRADQAIARLAEIRREFLGMALSWAIKDGDAAVQTRALVLHTDAAMSEHIAARGAGASTMVEDGRRVAQFQRSLHWSYALWLARALARQERPEPRETAALWFETVCAYAQQRSELGLLSDMVAEGLAIFSGDGRLHLARGILHLTYADRRVQQFLARQHLPAAHPRVTRFAPPLGVPLRPPGEEPVVPIGPPQSADAELALADTDLRRAVELMPEAREARVRLAHVLIDRGQAAEGIRVAQEALAGQLTPFFEVYATLILGRGYTRLGRFDEAREAFTRAAALAPDAQTPRVGLAQVALAQGQPQAGLDALVAIAGPGPDRPPPPEDEWHVYFRVHDPSAQALLTQLWSRAR